MLNLQFQYKQSTFSPCLSAGRFLIFHFLFLIVLTSCSVEKQIAKSAKADVLHAKPLQTAHVGISIFDPAANKYLYNYQGDKYFVPASNIKIPTCYAAMKYLGDSLVGIRYYIENDSSVIINPTGDPTFLHDDFKSQLVFDFLKKEKRGIYISDDNWKDEALGSGWAWNDYNESYMAERSPFPVTANIVKFYFKYFPTIGRGSLSFFPSYFEKQNNSFSIKLMNAIGHFVNVHNIKNEDSVALFSIKRDRRNNQFELVKTKTPFLRQEIPFATDTLKTAVEILKNDYNLKITIIPNDLISSIGYSKDNYTNNNYIIHSQPTDSLLKPMMHRSDNFFAEQSLLMVSNERLGVMNDAKIIDTLLKTDFKDLPQKPRWADGSGLSRYNLFTPQDFVAILNKMKNEFGMERLKVILPTSGEGTISSYYKADSGYIYGKTGTLSGVVAFSGFLYTKKGKLLIFSTLVNNHQDSATEVRKAMEKFLQGIRNNY